MEFSINVMTLKDLSLKSLLTSWAPTYPHTRTPTDLVLCCDCLICCCIHPCCQIDSQMRSTERIFLSKLHIPRLCTDFIRHQAEGHPGNPAPCRCCGSQRGCIESGEGKVSMVGFQTQPTDVSQSNIEGIVSKKRSSLQWRYAEQRSLWLHLLGHITPPNWILTRL